MKVRAKLISGSGDNMYVLSSNSTKELDKMVGKNVIISIDDKRSTPQNRYLWGVVYKTIERATGNSCEALHIEFKRMFLSDGAELFPEIKSTTKLSKQEFIAYYRAVAEWAMDFDGIFVQEPHENELWSVNNTYTEDKP